MKIYKATNTQISVRVLCNETKIKKINCEVENEAIASLQWVFYIKI